MPMPVTPGRIIQATVPASSWPRCSCDLRCCQASAAGWWVPDCHAGDGS